jgi:sulfate adenylyltransferase subunit 1
VTPGAHTEHTEKFRFPVQYVCRPQDSANPDLHDYRGFMGRVESGSIKVGDAVTVLPSGRESTVKAIQLGGVDIGEAFTEQSVTLLLADEIDTSRGDMIVKIERSAGSGQADRSHRLLDGRSPDRPRPHLPDPPHDARLEGQTGRHRPSPRREHAGKSTGRKTGDERHRQVTFKLAQPLFVDPYPRTAPPAPSSSSMKAATTRSAPG